MGDAVALMGERPIRLAVRDRTDSIVGIVQVLARPTRFGRQVLYAPHGPVWRRDGPRPGASWPACSRDFVTWAEPSEPSS